MHRGTAILINCNRDFLGDGSELFGRFFIALIRQATQAREHIRRRAHALLRLHRRVPAIHLKRPRT